MTLELDPLVPWPVAVAAAVVLVAAEVGPLRALASSTLSRRRRSALAAVAVVATLAAVAPLLGPRLTRESRKDVRALVLVDASRSMATADESGGRSRYDVAVEAARELAAHVGAPVALEAFPASGSSALPDRPEARTTALGDAIAGALVQRPRAAEPLGAIVLVTDGAQRTGRDPALAARDALTAGARVFALAVGTPHVAAPPRLVRASLGGPERAPAASTAVVRAQVELEGLEGAPVELELARDGAVVGRATVEGAARRTTREATFEVPLGDEGIRALSLRARAGAREVVAEKRVAVLPGKVIVALVDAPARWEHRFLRRALEDAPRIELARVDLWGARSSAELTAASLAAIDSADVVVLGDLPPHALGPEVGRAIARSVEDGRGLLVLGERRGFEGALELGLGPLLPAGIPGDALPVAQSFRPIATDAGRELLAAGLGLDAVRSAEVLERLPALAGFVPLAPAVRDATVLLEAPGARPLAVVGRHGLGRSALLASDATWRWAFDSHEGAAGRLHGALLRQLVLELAPRDAGLRAPLEIAPGPERVAPGQTLPVAALLRGPAKAAESIEASLVDLEGHVLARARSTPRGTATLELARDQTPGPLVVRAVAFAEGRELARAERVVVVASVASLDPDDGEAAGEPADRELLDRIADAGGGAAFACTDEARAEATKAVAGALDAARPVVRESGPLVSGPAYAVVLALLLGATWLLRRGGGLA